MTSSGWDRSAEAWLAEQGEAGDWGRRHVLDRVMLDRVDAAAPGTALDVGCGEGRFCRMMNARGITTTGIEPTARLRRAAEQRHPQGTYVDARAEALPFRGETFDLEIEGPLHGKVEVGQIVVYWEILDDKIIKQIKQEAQ